MKKKIAIAAAFLMGAVTLTACGTDAEVASYNISQQAEQFKLERRIVFFNGITDKYLLEIRGRCSVETTNSALDGALEVTCKVGPNAYKKHFLGLSDNVSYFVEQLKSVDVSVYQYTVIFKPDVILPDIKVETQLGK
jgi:hypothetical protein